ncbi:MAG: YfhO family protein [Chloroflexi bacterium]|nr:MAG: YfhO family protein [Chloroflexota bacterium]
MLVLLIALSVLDLFTVNWHNNFQASPPDAQTRAPEYLRPVVADNSLFRTYNEFRLFGNFGDLFGLEDTGGASPLRLARYEALTTLPMQRLWALLNVKYVITWRQSLADLGLQSELVARQRVSDTESTYVHRLLHVGPRAVVVSRVEVISDEHTALERLASPDFDFTQQVVLEAPLARPIQGDAAGSATLVEHAAARYVWQARAPGDALFVLSENDYPGWHAFVDGIETSVLRADYSLMAISLPAGDHRVEFVFDSMTVKLGALISALSISGLAGAWLISRWHDQGNPYMMR